MIYTIERLPGGKVSEESYESIATLENKKDRAWALAHQSRSYLLRGA